MKRLAVIGIVLLLFVMLATPVAAGLLQIGNDTQVRPVTDTRANFVIIDTNHPAGSAFSLHTFKYYASALLPFRFVLVDESYVVKWVSSEILPTGIGVNTFVSPAPVQVQSGWNLGLYFASTGAVPFEYTGAPAWYTVGGYGVPVVGTTLSFQNSSNRIYSFIATNELQVSIDIKPGSYPNSINLNEQGLLPVAILGSASFDVHDINPSTIIIGSVSLATRGSAKAPKQAYSYEDVNLDGDMDLMAFFSVPQLVSDGALNSSTTELELSADTIDGSYVTGRDLVSIVPP